MPGPVSIGFYGIQIPDRANFSVSTMTDANSNGVYLTVIAKKCELELLHSEFPRTERSSSPATSLVLSKSGLITSCSSIGCPVSQPSPGSVLILIMGAFTTLAVHSAISGSPTSSFGLPKSTSGRAKWKARQGALRGFLRPPMHGLKLRTQSPH